MNDDLEKLREEVARELRSVADDLEDGALSVTGPVEYTRAFDNRKLPAEITIPYYDERGNMREIEVRRR